MTSTHAPKRTEATGAAAEGVLREEAEELRSRPSASSHSGIAHTDGAPVASAIAEPGEPGEPEESREPGTGANARAPHAAYDAEGSPGTDAEAAKGTHDPPIAPPPPPEHNLLQALQDIQTNPFMAPGTTPLLWLRGLRVEGVENVRPGFLISVFRPYLDRRVGDLPWSSWLYGERLTHVRPGQPATLRGLTELTESISMDLSAFDIFRAINARLEPSTQPGAGKEDVEIVLQCVPKGRYFLKTSTDLGNNGDKSVSIQGHARNVFGGAEMVEASATWGTKTRRAFNVLLSTPLLGSPVFRASLAASTVDRDCTAWSSVWEAVRGIRSAVTFTGGTPGSVQELAADLSHRHVGYPSASASPAMRALMGDTVKAALSHTWTRDTSDDPLLASEGWSSRLAQEIAGAGGSAAHYRLEAEARVSRALEAVLPRHGHSRGTSDGWGVSLAGAAGFLRTFNRQPSCFSDRFHLGGPTSVRMLRQNSMGPKGTNTHIPDTPEHGDALGGDAYWSLGASLFAPFIKREWGDFKWHAFVNAGQVALMDQAKPLVALTGPSSSTGAGGALTRAPALAPTAPAPVAARNCASGALHDLWTQLSLPTITAGIGLVYTQGALRAELNAGAPLASRRSDGTRKGLQLGVGVSFL